MKNKVVIAQMVTIPKKSATKKSSSVTPSFLKILVGVNKKYGNALKELAKR